MPAHDAKCAAEGNRRMSTPISAISVSAASRLSPGMLCKCSMCAGFPVTAHPSTASSPLLRSQMSGGGLRVPIRSQQIAELVPRLCDSEEPFERAAIEADDDVAIDDGDGRCHIAELLDLFQGQRIFGDIAARKGNPFIPAGCRRLRASGSSLSPLMTLRFRCRCTYAAFLNIILQATSGLRLRP
jgi:hypothetical protein